MNPHAKYLSGLLSVLTLSPLSGCASRPDLTLEPPSGTEWVTVAVKLPEETEALPLDVLYRSGKCQCEDYDPQTESHIRKERGFNPQQVYLSDPDSEGIRRAKIALDGGGKCDWKLSGIRVGLQLSRFSALAKGKTVVPTDYVFDFDDEGYRNSFGQGIQKKAYKDLIFKTEFYPMIVVNNMFNETYAQLFAGDERYEKWNRYYRVYGTKRISIESVLYTKKLVRLESPKNRRDSPGMTVMYPDGSSEIVNDIYPSYDKLLSMK